MKLRTLKSRTAARVLFRARVWAPDRFDVAWHPDDWCEDWDDEPDPELEGWYACPSCGADTDPHTEDECWHCGEAV